MASTPFGQEKQAADRMKKFWTDASKTELYNNWPLGIVQGVFYEGGLYDTTPLKTFIDEQTKDLEVQRDIKVGIVDVLSGKFTDFQKATLTNRNSEDNLSNLLYASFAWPGVFPPVKAFGSEWFDGSAVYDVDIITAIGKCKTLGY